MHEDRDQQTEPRKTAIDSDPARLQDLEAGLRRLGIRELEQRLEVAPLLADESLDPQLQTLDMPCCVCKLEDPTELAEDGMLPYPTMVKW